MKFINYIFFIPILILACNETEPTKIQETSENIECKLNSDCDLGFICEASKCVEKPQCVTSGCACESIRDCFLGTETCDFETKICIEKECNIDQDCPLEYICQEGKCLIDTESDRDRDLVPDAIDLCPLLADAMQEDNDLDMSGDACDADDDNDGMIDIIDNCRLIKNPNQGDADLDGEGNACDLEVKGTTIIGKLNALEIKLGNYVDSSIMLIGSTATAVIQEDGTFQFEQAVSEQPNISLRINLKGYQETIETALVNLKSDQYDLGRIDLSPLKVEMKGTVIKEQFNQNDQIIVATIIQQQQVSQSLTSKQGYFNLSTYQSDQKLILSTTGFLTKELDLIWNEDLRDFEFIDEDQTTQRLSQSNLILRRDLSNSIVGSFQTTINTYSYDLIDFKLLELNTQLEKTVPVRSNGSFELDHLAQGLYRMEINAQGHVLIRDVLQVQEGVNQLGMIILTPELELEDAFILQSNVMLHGANRHDGIQVRALINQQLQAATLSGEDGSYVLTLNRLPHTLNFYKEGYVSQSIEINWDDVGHRFTALQNGVVVDANQMQVVLSEQNNANLKFKLISEITGFDWTTKCVVNIQNLSTNQTRQVNPNSQGLVDLGSLNMGIYQIEVLAQGHLPYLKALSLIDGLNDLGEISLTTQVVAEEAYLLQSKALLSGRNQHDGIQVRALINQQSQGSDLSGLDGTYALRLNRLNHTLSFYKEGYVSESMEINWDEVGQRFTALQNGVIVDANQMQVVLSEQNNASLKFKLISEIAGFDWTTKCVVNIQNLSTNQTRQVNPNSQGLVDLGSLNMGIYQIEVLAQGHLPYLKALSLIDGLNDLGEISLTTQVVAEEAYLLQSKALLSGRNQHDGIQVRALINQQSQGSDLSGLDGTYALRLNRLNHTLSFYKEGYVSESMEINWDEVGQRFTALQNGVVVDANQMQVVLSEQNNASLKFKLISEITGFDWTTKCVVNIQNLSTNQTRQVNPNSQGLVDLGSLNRGIYQIEVLAQGHLPYLKALSLIDGLNDLGEISLTTQVVAEEAYLLQSKALLSGRNQHDGIQVRALINQQSQVSDLSGLDGTYALRLNRLNHTLSFYKEGYVSESMEINWDEVGQRFTALQNGVIVDANQMQVVLSEQNNASLKFKLISEITGFDWTTKCVVNIQNLSTNQTRQINPNSQGLVDLGSLNRGIYQIEVLAQGHLPYLKALSLIDGLNDLGEISLTTQVVAEEAYLLQSKALLSGRNQHDGIQVRALINQQSQGSDLSGLDGTYALRLNRLNHTLSFYKETYVAKSIEITWDDVGQRFTTLENGNVVDLSTFIMHLAEDNGPNGDLDRDGVINASDNCLYIANSDQIDTDGDTFGNECDEDDDHDGIEDVTELLLASNPLSIDSDGDGLDDFKELVLIGTSLNLADTDRDGENDLLEVGNDVQNPKDSDGDGVIDALESSVRDSDRDGANDEIDGPSDFGDLEGDGILNGVDNCVLIKNVTQLNLDGDAFGDECDDDDDNDQSVDSLDNCPRVSNTNQKDTDLDAIGDICDEDDDNDGLADVIDPYPLLVDFDQDGVLDGDGQNAVDNCPGIANADQRDNDGDDEGDICDDDDDNDDVLDINDNCQYVSNTNQLNSEPTPDSFGNACDLDDDNDGILDTNDNCPLVINVIQSDLDFDGLGNACDTDDDGDGVLDVNDNCPTIRNVDQLDSNGDGVGNACAQDIDGDGFADVADNCPNQFNVDQKNIDNDNLGDACDPDIDGDGFANQSDNCVFVYNNPQLDLDGDTIGDPCDPDDDNDGVADTIDSCVRIVNLNQDPDGDNIDSACDNCPLADNRYQIDIDKDALGDECDPDMDNDGFANAIDNCPKMANANQSDVNGNGLGDTCEIRFEWYVSDGFTVTDSARLNDKFFVAMDGGGIVQLNLNGALNAESSRYHYTMTDGLPSHDVKMISVDNAGNLWAVTPLGLSVRYSGNGIWETFKGDTIRCGATDVNIDYSSVGGVIDLDVNPVNGDVYLAYVDKIVRKQGNLLSCFEKGTGVLNAAINSVDVSPDGQAIWVGTAIGASRYIEGIGWQSYIDVNLGFAIVKQVGFLQENGTWSAIVMNDVIANPKATKIDSNGNVVLAFKNINTPLASFHYTESKLGAKTLNISLFISKSTIPALDFNILRKSDDEILIASRTSTNVNGLKKFNPNGTLENTAYVVNFNSTGVLNAVAFDDQGNYYLASANGLYSSKDNFKYTTASGLASNVINDVVIDQTGIIWIATDGGLNYFKNGLFGTLALGEKCTKLLVDDNNVVWVIKGGNLFYLENDQFILSANRPPLFNAIADMKLDENGEIWSNMGLNLAKKGNLNQFVGQSNGRFIGIQMDYLSSQRFISTYETNVILNYANQSQRNINIGTSKLKPLAYRSGNGIEAWLIAKGSLAKIVGWELSLENSQLDGNSLVYLFPTMISMPNQNRLSKTEVTHEQYKFCLDLGGCPTTSLNLATAKHPLANVDWYKSRIYSQWLGGDLPTEAEWYYAATGGGQNIEYPWGNVVPTCQLANYSGCVGTTAPVCSTTGGNTAQGLCDMGGNLYEWTLDKFDPNDTSTSARRVARGGSYRVGSPAVASRTPYSPSYINNEVGFRVSDTRPLNP